jgi:ABC-2 type transport system permease protein
MGDFSDIGSFKGFVTAEVFTFLPLLLAIYAIVNGTGTLAGEEDDGILEPLLALPLARWKIIFFKWLALSIALLLILLIVGIVSAISLGTLPSDVNTGGVDATSLFLASVGTWPILLFFATLSLFLGAFMPSRRTASVAAAVVLIVSFFGNNLADLVSWLGDIQFLFAFNYYKPGMMLVEGLDVSNTAILVVSSAVLLGLGMLAFHRRNITVGAWPWQRGRLPATER